MLLARVRFSGFLQNASVQTRLNDQETRGEHRNAINPFVTRTSGERRWILSPRQRARLLNTLAISLEPKRDAMHDQGPAYALLLFPSFLFFLSDNSNSAPDIDESSIRAGIINQPATYVRATLPSPEEEGYWPASSPLSFSLRMFSSLVFLYINPSYFFRSFIIFLSFFLLGVINMSLTN